MIRCALVIPLLSASSLFAQATITELKLVVVPESKKVRPLEFAAVQVRVIGTVQDSNGDTKTGRLQRDGWKATIREPSGGWLTKPFFFQGAEPNPAEFIDRRQGFAGILGQGFNQYTVKDTALYVAPPTPGKYTVQFELEGKKAETTIEVTPDAPSQLTPEAQNFGPEKRVEDPYRKLAEHWAPFLAQETWFTPKADMLARFDYDGDWKGDNNWDDLPKGTSQAYVYYAAMETSTHVFLIYNFFHPRDYSDNCVMGSCHENDNEGAVFAIQKDGSEFGRLQVMETLAHNNVYDYTNDPGLQNNVQDIDGPIVFWKDSHPMIFLEGGGHGSYAANDRRSLFAVESMSFNNTGITYVYKGVAERPKTAIDREVGYDLLPIYENWWLKSRDPNWKEHTFDEYYEYLPFGSRPRMKNPQISGAFWGRKQASNKARPFWGWFDNRSRKAKQVNTGQWALDPAWSMSRNLKFPAGDAWSLDYNFNPYLDQDSGGSRASMARPSNFVARNFDAAAVAARSAPGSALKAGGSGGLLAAAGAALGDPKAQAALGGLLEKVGVGSVATDQMRQVGAAAGGGRLSQPQSEQPAAAGAQAAAPAQAPTQQRPAAEQPAPAAAPPTPKAGAGLSAAEAFGSILQSSGNQCVINIDVAGPGELNIRGNDVSFSTSSHGSSKPAMKCTAPLPQSSVQLAAEKKAGGGSIQLSPGSAANDFTTRIAVLPESGVRSEHYEIVLRW